MLYIYIYIYTYVMVLHLIGSSRGVGLLQNRPRKECEGGLLGEHAVHQVLITWQAPCMTRRHACEIVTSGFSSSGKLPGDSGTQSHSLTTMHVHERSTGNSLCMGFLKPVTRPCT